MTTHVLDRSGIASLDDLSAPDCRAIFSAMEREQAAFLAYESVFRSHAYPWPRDPLHTWSRCWEYPYVYRALATRCEKRSTEGGTRPLLADVGSGVTFFPFAVAKLGCRVVCTDVDPICERDLSRAALQVPTGSGVVEFRLGTHDRLPYSDAECDGAYCISVLEHIPEPGRTVGEIHRILKPGGLFCLTIDLDLRGDHEIGPAGYDRLHRVLQENFQLAAPAKGIHPRVMLTSTSGPYPVGIPHGLYRRLFLAKQIIRPLLGRNRRPADPFVLAVEGTLWRKP
jgi:SAM-dependent methyltransferase